MLCVFIPSAVVNSRVQHVYGKFLGTYTAGHLTLPFKSGAPKATCFRDVHEGIDARIQMRTEMRCDNSAQKAFSYKK